jgi:hypothetical protein
MVAAGPLLQLLGQLLTTVLAADRFQDRAADAVLTARLVAETDPMTGLPNRLAWQGALAQAQARFERGPPSRSSAASPPPWPKPTPPCTPKNSNAAPAAAPSPPPDGGRSPGVLVTRRCGGRPVQGFGPGAARGRGRRCP